MIYSKSCEYAIRSLIYLATQPEGQYCTIQEISHHQNIPTHFLGKLLQQLGKYNLVTSLKGRTGGFSLAIPAAEITLLKVIEHVDGLNNLNRCIIGLGECACELSCPVHESWAPVKASIMAFLRNQTIGGLADSLKSKEQHP